MRSKTLAVVLAAVLLLAGCTGSPGAGSRTGTDAVTPTDEQTTIDDATTTDDPTTTPTETTTTDGFYNAFRFEAVALSPAGVAREVAVPVGDLDPEQRDLALAALANGSAIDVQMVHGDGDPGYHGTLQDGEYVRHEGTYYRVNATVTGQMSGEGYSFDLLGPLRERHDDYDVATEEAVSVDSLTSTQRDLFEYAAPDADRREDATVHASRYYLPPEGGSLDDSGWLDGDPHYVRHEGDLFRISFDGRILPVVRMRVRYRLEPIAQSADSFVAVRLERYVVNVTDRNPPDPARSVVLSTIQNGTYEWEGTTDARPRRVELADEWIGDHSPEGSYAFVRYDGQIYRIEVIEIVE